MKLQLEQVDFSDNAAMSRAYVGSFYDDDFNKTLFPGVGPEAMLAGAMSRWPSSYCDPQTYQLKVMDADTGKLAAYSVWTFHNTCARDKLPPRTGIPPDYELAALRGLSTSTSTSTAEGRDEVFATTFSRKCQPLKDRLIGDTPTLRLGIMGTLPEYRRCGAARLMLDWATRFADQEGLQCYTEASTEGWPVYQKFGFEAHKQIESVLWNGVRYISTVVLRPPRLG